MTETAFKVLDVVEQAIGEFLLFYEGGRFSTNEGVIQEVRGLGQYLLNNADYLETMTNL